MLSNTSKYAIRAMIYLALHADRENIGIKKIAEELDIPAPFLAKILQVLAKRKLLKSTKGPNGGFSLDGRSKEISLFQIVTTIDGEDIFDKCLISTRNCHEEQIPCPLHDKYADIRLAFKRLFEEQSLEGLTRDIKQQNRIFAL
jgi:Rrf2 family protein